MNGNHRGVVALEDSNVVQRTVVALQRLTDGLYLDDAARIDGVVTLVECLDVALYLLSVDVGKES